MPDRRCGTCRLFMAGIGTEPDTCAWEPREAVPDSFPWPKLQTEPDAGKRCPLWERQPTITEAQLSVATDLRINQGMSLRAIAVWVGCTTDQLSYHFARRRVERFGGPPRGLRQKPNPHDETIRSMLAAGCTLTIIGRHIGRRPSFVSYRITAMERAASPLHVFSGAPGAGPKPVVSHLGLHGGQRAEQDVGECFATLRHGAEQHNDDGAHEAGGNAERDDHRAPGPHGA